MSKSFRVPCPSCEAEVLIKGENQIGRKTDCPKCKYRFTVPNPAGDDDDAGYDVVDAPKKKKGNPKALVGIVLGVVGVAVLGVGGYMMFGQEEEKPVVNSGGTGRTVTPNPTPAPKPDPKADPKNTKVDPKTIAKADPKNTKNIKPQSPGDPTKIGDPTAGGVTKEDTKPKPPEVVRPPAVMKDASNLLPGQSVAVLRAHLDRMRSTPVYPALFDSSVKDFFATCMTFDIADVESVHLCLVDSDRDPFTLIRTKKPFSEAGVYQKMDIEAGSPPTINARGIFKIKSNAFVTAISRVLSTETLFGESGIPITEDDKKRWAEKPLGLTVYDSQTLVIAEYNILARWLGELNKAGDPPFQTEVTPGAGGAAPANPAAPAAPAAPVPSRGDRGGGGKPAEPAPAPGTPMGESADGKIYDSKANYRTVRPDLKQMLNRLDNDEKNPATLLYADIIDQRLFEREQGSSAYDIVWFYVKNITRFADMFGFSVHRFDKDKINLSTCFHYVSESDVKKAVEERLGPLINNNKDLLGYFLGTKFDVTGSSGGGGGGDAGSAPLAGTAGRGGGGTGPAGTNDDGQVATLSKINISTSDLFAQVDFDYLVSADRYKSMIQPGIVSIMTQMKGRMAVLSGEASWYSLSSKFSRVLDGEKKAFPAGAMPRESAPERFGLPWPPDKRMSFFVDLLPYLNQGGLRSRIQDKKTAWYDKKNLPAATTWIPELLCPYYPQNAWRAYHPLADQGQAALGATNYVAVAGLGLDAARLNPSKPEHAKLVGITGYEWGSKAAEITDGLSNTIYMLQVPPGFNRPWIAGGGATVMGVDDKAANPVNDFVHTTPTGKRGTYALLADGSVRFIPENVDAAVFKALVTRAGGEAISDLNTKLPKEPVPKNIETELKGGGSGPSAKTDRTKIDAAELQKLQGKWKVVSLMKDGIVVPTAALDKLELECDIEDTRITGHTKGAPDESDLILELNTKANPKRIVTRGDGKNDRENAIYSLDSDGKKLRIRVRTKPKDANDFPTELILPKADEKGDGYMELTKVQ